ncbi:TPA: fimbria/pilus outer membrane usher protein, partial [Klebsiella aerogenes]|nr:fimbria/pilus outer membrane usher protein [Klebsiella aerogenes]
MSYPFSHSAARTPRSHTSSLPARFIPVALAIFPALAVHSALADDVVFDTGALKSQGLDTSLASQFRRGDVFPPGVNRVSLKVNGVARGRYPARFDGQGRLCVDAGLLRQAGLRVPAGVPERRGEEGDAGALAEGRAGICPDLIAVWPQFTVQADPGEAALALIVPQEALDPDADAVQWQHSGTAALLNYSMQYMGSQTSGSRMNYWQVQTEAGFNAGDWVVRSNQSLYRFDDTMEADYQNAYAQRTFTGLKSTLQVGQIPLTGGLFGIGQVIGFQMTPEQGLYAGAGTAVVTGIADGPSVVEIRQLGVPVFHTT